MSELKRRARLQTSARPATDTQRRPQHWLRTSHLQFCCTAAQWKNYADSAASSAAPDGMARILAKPTMQLLHCGPAHSRRLFSLKQAPQQNCPTQRKSEQHTHTLPSRLVLCAAKTLLAASETANPVIATCQRTRVTGRGACLRSRTASMAGRVAILPTRPLRCIPIAGGGLLSPGNDEKPAIGAHCGCKRRSVYTSDAVRCKQLHPCIVLLLNIHFAYGLGTKLLPRCTPSRSLGIG